MGSAIAILMQALRSLLQSPATTLRVILPALVLLGGVGVLMLTVAPDLLRFGFVQDGAPFWPQGGSGLIWAGLIILAVCGYALMAILWHRHGLSEGDVGWPPVRIVFGYLWRVLLISLIQVLISIVLVIPLLISIASATPDAGQPSLPAMLLTTFMTGLLLIWLSLRLSLVLPAAALGQRMGFGESWSITAPLVRPLWGVATLLAALNTLLSGLLGLIGSTTPALTLLVEAPVYVAQGLLIFSVLTTLYAFLVQDRPMGLRSIRHGL